MATLPNTVPHKGVIRYLHKLAIDAAERDALVSRVSNGRTCQPEELRNDEALTLAMVLNQRIKHIVRAEARLTKEQAANLAEWDNVRATCDHTVDGEGHFAGRPVLIEAGCGGRVVDAAKPELDLGPTIEWSPWRGRKVAVTIAYPFDADMADFVHWRF